MRVIVVEHHGYGSRRVFEGTEDEIRADLLHAFPSLARGKLHFSAEELVRALDAKQAYTAVVDRGDIHLTPQMVKSDFNGGTGAEVLSDQLGLDDDLQEAVAAAAFLAGCELPLPEAVRQALLACDERPLDAALVSVGLPTTPDVMAALRGILATALAEHPMSKAEEAPPPQQVVAVTADGQAYADEVQRAIADGQVFPVQLGGRHSGGILVAYDSETHRRLLLKPGSGPQNPAAGDTESHSSQAKRESAFWAVMQSWGLGADGPETHLLLLDGREYAAMRLLPYSFQNFNKLRRDDPGLPRRLLRLYLHDGTLHKWAALYYVNGEVDGNAGNVMARGDEVKLIDHGSSYAGQEFSPASDRNTFVPYFLRAWAPDNFLDLSPEEKLRSLPRLPAQAVPAFKAWLDSLSKDKLSTDLHRYGIEAAPSVARLERLQHAAQHIPADLAVLQPWVLP